MSQATPAPARSGDDIARANALTLALASGLAGANASVVFSTGALIGASLSGGDIGLATIPTTFFVLGTALATYPVAYASRLLGRRTAFLLGNLAGIAAGLGAAIAVAMASFWIFCAACFLAGTYHAVVQSYRYAAADTATAGFKPKAISWVLAGGLAAGAVGPQIVIWTQDATPAFPFFATFLAQAAVALVAVIVTQRFVDQPMGEVLSGPIRPLSEIAREPRFLVAVATGTMAQALMNFVMTAAPLAMHICGHSVTDSSLGLQWHIMAMFAPSFFTGSLIARFGKEGVAAAGLLILGVCGIVHLMGTTVAHFWIGLVLLGVGWNFAFVSATAIVTDCHTPAERAKVQGFNDCVIFGTTTCGSLLAGQVLASFGWGVINAAIIPAVLVCVVLVVSSRRRVVAMAQPAE